MFAFACCCSCFVLWAWGWGAFVCACVCLGRFVGAVFWCVGSFSACPWRPVSAFLALIKLIFSKKKNIWRLMLNLKKQDMVLKEHRLEFWKPVKILGKRDHENLMS